MSGCRSMSIKQKFVGRSVPRLEDRPLLTGQGRFAADISFPDQWHMRVVRSPVAHGKIRSIGAARHLRYPAFMRRGRMPMLRIFRRSPFRLTGLKTLEPYRQPVIARDIVRYVGEPVAVVFAENAYLAEDAAELIELSIETFANNDVATGQPDVYEGELIDGTGDVVQKAYGDIDAAFRDAHAIVSLELSIGRHSGVPMETRGAIARYDETRDILEFHGAAKVPHWNRDTIAQMSDGPKDRSPLRRPCRRRFRHSR